MSRTVRTWLVAGAAAAVVVSAAPQASAANIAPGDLIRIVFEPAGEIGRFGVKRDGSDEILFYTYCAEFNEYLADGALFLVEAVSKEADLGGVGGGSPDPLDGATAWLYETFLANMGAFSSVAGWDAASVADKRNALQDAIWAIEEELTPPLSVLAQGLVDLALGQPLAALNGAYANVYVLNLRWAQNFEIFQVGDRAQDLLYRQVPEPVTLLLLGGGLLGVAAARRRLNARKAA